MTDEAPPFGDLQPLTGLREGFAFSVTVSNDTYLKNMYVKLDHARQWFQEVDDVYHAQTAVKRPRRASKRLVSKNVLLVSRCGTPHGVMFELVSSAGQFHCRLSRGWQSFCKANAVGLHDRLTFETHRDHDVAFVFEGK